MRKIGWVIVSREIPKAFIFLVLVGVICSCDSQAKRFISIPSSDSNIDFVNGLSPTPEHNILTYLYYYNGGGVAAADFNEDGLTDLFFTGNEASDRLYLNRGDFTFEDVTEAANLADNLGWSTGVSHVDINQDGLLDLYICKVGAYKSMQGQNALFINQGVDEKGIPSFVESAEVYGLDFSGFSTQATFLDYDLDGDLDMFLLNHSVHPSSSYGKGTKRKESDTLSGDRFYRNDSGKFTDVSAEVGIFQGTIGYGLGVSVSDINNDGFPDIYVGNDFFENDYLYINQKDGTFKETISNDPSKLGHTSHYSMGNNIADLNNDGLVDIVSLDMLPEDLKTYKTSGNEYPFPVYRYYLKNGYAPQYMQNTLHLNQGNETFSDVAFLSGIAATEWSWGVLAADIDMDGRRDLYITNGIKGATNDMDFISFIAQEKIQKKISQGMNVEDMEFINQLPEKKASNYAFRNTGDLSYQDVSDLWFDDTSTFSNGCAYADLDNDGDLDLIVNNIGQAAGVYKNLTNEEGKSFLKLAFSGPKGNRFGVGAKVKVFARHLMIVEENYPTRSYLSAVPPVLTIGLDSVTVVDSIHVVWPGGKFQKLVDLETNRTLTLRYSDATGNYYASQEENQSPLENSTQLIDFKHVEEACLEFEREPLIPFAKSNEGPKVSISDINADGLEDLFIGGAKRQGAGLFVQNRDGSFSKTQESMFERDAINEDTDQVFFDAEGDGDEDLLVVSGGNEFKNGRPLTPRLYLNTEGILTLDTTAFQNVEINASVVRTIDLDGDGDEDVLIGSNASPGEFGQSAKNYVFENADGDFNDITGSHQLFANVGLVEDIAIVDMDENGFPDVILAGNWMPITVFYNDGQTLKAGDVGLTNSNGWWNTVVSADFDKDGDLDLVAGNWGLNSRLTASVTEPINLYRNDFDDNGSIEPIVTYYYQGEETLLPSKDEVVKQLPFLNKKFLSYKSFAEATLADLFSGEKLEKSDRKQVFELGSCYFENKGNNTFEMRLLPTMAQLSSIHAVEVQDFDEDGFSDLLLVGNSYEISTQLGRLDASHGQLLLNDQKGFFKAEKSSSFNVAGQARDVAEIQIGDETYYVITINNDQPIFLK